jgi:hypothetical protein
MLATTNQRLYENSRNRFLQSIKVTSKFKISTQTWLRSSSVIVTHTIKVALKKNVFFLFLLFFLAYEI